MVSKCANTLCAAKFLYLREGALFSFELGSRVAKPGLLNGFELAGTFRQFQYFWLCPQCCKTMILQVEAGRVVVVRRDREPSRSPVTHAYSKQAAA